MIEPMKKVTVVCLADARTSAVEALRDLGTVHVVDVVPPDAAEIDQLLRRREHVERALNTVKPRHGIVDRIVEAEAPEAVADEILKTAGKLGKLDEQLAEIRRQAEQLSPWGSFSRARLEELQQRGLQLKLGQAPAAKLPQLPQGATLHEVNRQGGQVYFVVVAPESLELELEEVVLPDCTDLGEIAAKEARCQVERDQLSHKLDHLASAIPHLQDQLHHLEEDLAFSKVQHGMGGDRTLSYLQGYVPAKRVEELSAAAKANGWALRVEEPAEDDAQVPTLVSLPKWVEPIRVVFQGLGIMPGYAELDISACFLLFFSVFFAILIGDAGYGGIFLVATLVLRKVFPKAPSQPFWLFGILSACTIAWGVMTGTYFGIGGQDGVRTLVPWLRNDANVMGLCFLLGAIHLTVAHVWNALVLGRRLKALGELSWASILWGNYFLAGFLVLEKKPPQAMLWLYGVGIVGVVLFSSPNRNPLKAVGGGLGELLLGIVNSFVDVVSYVRLFAVGAASLAVEQSFNQMAAGLSMPGPLTVLIGALILIFGHGLNIMLGAMGVLVHGIRLNVLEFSGHLGMQWSGKAYAPLVRRKRAEG